jgi:hypothetical protein
MIPTLRLIGGCEHTAGECRDCSGFTFCVAPEKEILVETCSCLRRPGRQLTSTFRWDGFYDYEGVLSHECPIHGAELAR